MLGRGRLPGISNDVDCMRCVECVSRGRDLPHRQQENQCTSQPLAGRALSGHEYFTGKGTNRKQLQAFVRMLELSGAAEMTRCCTVWVGAHTSDLDTQLVVVSVSMFVTSIDN